MAVEMFIQELIESSAALKSIPGIPCGKPFSCGTGKVNTRVAAER
jgi:hypothetical protein